MRGAKRGLASLALSATVVLGLCRPTESRAEEATDVLAATPSDLLSQAEEAMTTIDYEKSRALAQRAIEQGGMDQEQLTRAYRLLALSAAQLQDSEQAGAAFLRLFALEPQSNIAMRLSPSRRTAMLDARGFWSVRKEGFGLTASYSRHERELVLQLRDAIHWARQVHVWWRVADRPYVKRQLPVESDLVFRIEGIGPSERFEVYAFAVDEQNNVLMQFGRERDPHVFELSDEELAALRRRDIRGGQTGSFARRLEELGVQVGVHGYLSLEFTQSSAGAEEGEEAAAPDEAGASEAGEQNGGGSAGFDLHHATAMIRASLYDTASVEIALEWEHLGRGSDGFYFPHAFMDLKFGEPVILRAGFFEAPVGAFNEYLYPDFLRITAFPPLFSANVVPALWSEVGLQLRGRVPLGSRPVLTYAAFVSNGLEQPDPHPNDGIVLEGGDISGMRFNARDVNDKNKAGGGRLGLELGEVDVGVSAYTGQYSAEQDSGRRLSLFDADFSLRSKRFTLRAEGALALQETTQSLLEKYGFYVLAAARPSGYFEPYVQYDYLRGASPAEDGGRLQRILLGVASYPFPYHRATSTLRLKSEAGYEFPEAGERHFIWYFQLTTGF